MSNFRILGINNPSEPFGLRRVQKGSHYIQIYKSFHNKCDKDPCIELKKKEMNLIPS
jgi:hypothetical protein